MSLHGQLGRCRRLRSRRPRSWRSRRQPSNGCWSRRDGERVANLMAEIPCGGALPWEMVQTIASHRGCWHFTDRFHGQSSPEGFWYDQPLNEWVLVVSGARAIAAGGRAGDGDDCRRLLNIPTHTAIGWSGPTRGSRLWRQFITRDPKLPLGRFVARRRADLPWPPTSTMAATMMNPSHQP